MCRRHGNVHACQEHCSSNVRLAVQVLLSDHVHPRRTVMSCAHPLNTILAISMVSVLAASTVSAQNAPAGSQEPVKLNLTIESQLVRFTSTQGEALDWRLEVVNPQS